MGNGISNSKGLPLVTVGIPAYNHERYVGKTIESVINQTYENIELIIINDGSKDSTDEVIQSYINECRERFVRFEYRNRKNRGLSATLNEILHWSKGKYFTAVASDDILLKDKVSLLAEKLEALDDSYAVAFGNAIFIDDKGQELYLDKRTGCPTYKGKGVNLFLDYFTRYRDFSYKDPNAFGSYKTLIAGNYLPAMSSIMKTDKVKEVGGWTNGNVIEDWEMWLKLSKRYRFVYIDRPVALYRQHDSNACRLMEKDILYDSIKLLKKEKSFAIKNALNEIYYESLVSHIIGIRHFSYSRFLMELTRNLSDISFLLALIQKLVKNI